MANQLKKPGLSDAVEYGESDNVGYKKPPKKYQFQKGKSGNPKGRPRRLKTLKQALLEEVHKQIKVVANGKPTTVAGLHLLAKQMVKAAIELKKPALPHLLKLLQEAEAERADMDAAAAAAEKQALENPTFSWTEEQEELYRELQEVLAAEKKEE
ncbi:DUF5681 domain-containing protein [Aestuariivirga sp.]|uniref:DUF5681 domain-containing protein n=1 Tax=Aestuariivirga sp. TaxID=2650926 RepID=UPI00391B0D63